jgi:hypothetical protein
VEREYRNPKIKGISKHRSFAKKLYDITFKKTNNKECVTG